MDVRVSADPTAAAAAHIAQLLRDAADRRGSATLAVSGGSTAPPLFAAMLDDSVSGPAPWSSTSVLQVDERVAPDGDEDRNASQLEVLPAEVSLLPVTSIDIASEARRYGEEIVDPLDVVHLGVGDDGHTASWPPEPHPDALRALTSTERAFVVGEFHGRVRMTLGPDVVNAARSRVVLTTGADKAEAVRRWLGGDGVGRVDATLPVAAVAEAGTVVFLDEAAASLLDD